MSPSNSMCRKNGLCFSNFEFKYDSENNPEENKIYIKTLKSKWSRQ